VTVDVAGVRNILGAFPGAKKVSIARNQAAAPDVSPSMSTNGRIKLSTGGAPAFYNAAAYCRSPRVAFQDGYLFFTIAALPSVCNRAEFARDERADHDHDSIQVRRDIASAIPFSGVMLFFTTGHFGGMAGRRQRGTELPYGRLTSARRA